MEIAIIANDTRGGVQPYVALALGLRAAGHGVRAILIGGSGFEELLRGEGIPVALMAGSPEEMHRAAAGGLKPGSMAGMRLAGREMTARISGWTRASLEASRGADVILGGIGGGMIGRPVAETLRIPFIEAQLQPIGPATSAFPGPLVNPPAWTGGPGRKLSHRLSALGISLPFGAGVARARADLGLPKKAPPAPKGLPVLYGYSPVVVPKPAEWGPERHVTGYWDLPADPGWTPPADLAAFLAAGPPPVLIGFGSMPADDPASLGALIVDAIGRAGVRAIVAAGWGALGTVPPSASVLTIGSAPFGWLLPRTAAVVHHGGAGTTGAALGAGIPAVVVPFGVDQPFWGNRVHALGAGPRPIPFHDLSATALAGAIREATTDARMRERAAAIGTRIRAEDGVSTAVAVLERWDVTRDA